MTQRAEFAGVLAELGDASRPVPVSTLYRLSRLDADDLAALEAAWPGLDPERRLNLVERLNEIEEANFEAAFEPIFRLALDDAAGPVRAAAIRAMWESEDSRLVPQLLHFLRQDPAPEVRAAAASSLGGFVYLGEMEELPAVAAKRIVDALLAVIGGGDEVDVRRRALEAVGYSGRPEVAPLIAAAYDSGEPRLRVSAVFAMGRTADARWAPQVRAELRSDQAEMRFEAARAAGEMELPEAARDLARLAKDEDEQVQEAAVWSLSQIGGDLARATLERLAAEAEATDGEDYLAEALDNLAFNEEVRSFALFEFGQDEDERDDEESGELDDEFEDEAGELGDEDDDVFDDDDPPAGRSRLN